MYTLIYRNERRQNFHLSRNHQWTKFKIKISTPLTSGSLKKFTLQFQCVRVHPLFSSLYPNLTFMTPEQKHDGIVLWTLTY